MKIRITHDLPEESYKKLKEIAEYKGLVAKHLGEKILTTGINRIYSQIDWSEYDARLNASKIKDKK